MIPYTLGFLVNLIRGRGYRNLAKHPQCIVWAWRCGWRALRESERQNVVKIDFSLR